ncbi:hypothetical protein D3C73_1361990 [compost metagenome]
MQTQITDAGVHELRVLDLLEHLELLCQSLGPQIDGKAVLILQVFYWRLDPRSLTDAQAVFSPQNIILQLLEGIGLSTFILALQRLDPVAPEGVELLALCGRLQALDERDVLL